MVPPKVKRVKVTDDVHERLRRLKEEYGLTFNDLISVSLTVLEQDKSDIFVDSDIIKVTVNLNKANLDYNYIQMLVSKGYDIFIPKINRRQANYIKRRMQKTLTTDVKVCPARVEDQEGFLYIFIPRQSYT